MKKGTIFYRKKMSRETILTIVYLFLTGYPISNMPPLVQVTERSIMNLLKEVITRFKKYEALIVAPSDYIPKIIDKEVQREDRIGMIDAYKGYEKFIEKYLADGVKKPLTGVINKSQYTKTEGFVTYALFGQSKQSVEDKMASLGRGKKITTALIEIPNFRF